MIDQMTIAQVYLLMTDENDDVISVDEALEMVAEYQRKVGIIK